MLTDNWETFYNCFLSSAFLSGDSMMSQIKLIYQKIERQCLKMSHMSHKVQQEVQKEWFLYSGQNDF